MPLWHYLAPGSPDEVGMELLVRDPRTKLFRDAVSPIMGRYMLYPNQTQMLQCPGSKGVCVTVWGGGQGCAPILCRCCSARARWACVWCGGGRGAGLSPNQVQML